MAHDVAPALAALDGCDAALDALDAKCCDPGRSPRMQALAVTLRTARDAIACDADSAALRGAVATLEDAGAQVGRLQVGCCAPGRLPLYAELLEGLTTAQLSIARATGTGH